MKLTLYGYPNCSTCRSAVRWLRGQGHVVDEVHIVEATPNEDVLRDLIQKSGLDRKKWFNVAGRVYKEMSLKDHLPHMPEDEQLKLLASNGMLLKRPIVTDGTQVSIGYSEDAFNQKWGAKS